MAIVKIIETDNELTIKVENGDLVALKQVQDKWKFKDKESALRFALAVLVKAAEGGNKVMIEENGKPTSLIPGDSLLKKDTGDDTSV